MLFFFPPIFFNDGNLFLYNKDFFFFFLNNPKNKTKTKKESSLSDACELVPEAGRQDALHLLHDEVEWCKQRAQELEIHKWGFY